MRRTLSIALALLTASAASACLAAEATQAPQVWTTNVVAGEFPTQHAALSAVRAKGGIYALAERVERVEQSGTTTTFVYGSNPRGPDIGAWGNFTMQGAVSNPHASEEGAVAAVKAQWDINGAVCPIKTKVAPKNEWRAIRIWYSGDSEQDARDYGVEYSVPPSCFRATTSSQAARYRTLECPQYTTWDSTGKACLATSIAKISSRPIVCSDCDLRGNPINVSTGDKYQVEKDLSLSWLEFTRYYHSSHSVPNARLGPGWTHALNMQLFVTDSSTAALVLPNGNILPFVDGYEALDGSGWRIKYASGMYELRKPDQTLKFSVSKLVEIDDVVRGVTKLRYDAIGRLTAAVHSSGRSVTFGYGGATLDAAGALLSVSRDGEVLVSYDYDDEGRLVSANYLGGSARHYLYESVANGNALTGIEDQQGNRYATYSYTADGLAVSSEHAGSTQKARFEYAADGTTLHTNALGAVEQITFTAAVPYRKIASITTQAGTESWEYAPSTGAGADFRRRVKSHTHRSGRVDLFTYQDLTDDGFGEVRVKREAEASNRAEATVSETWRRRDTNQIVKQVGGDRTKTWLHNARGQVIQESTITSAGETRTTAYRYCDQVVAQTGCPVLGLLLSADGPMPGPADTITYSYYSEDAPGCASGSASCFYRKGDLWKVANPMGHTVEYLAYDGAGRVATQSDANGLATSFEYHPRGWLTATRVHGVGGLPDRITRIEYWPTGLTRSVTQPDGSYVS
jgi:YD repeat-containing protein